MQPELSFIHTEEDSNEEQSMISKLFSVVLSLLFLLGLFSATSAKTRRYRDGRASLLPASKRGLHLQNPVHWSAEQDVGTPRTNGFNSAKLSAGNTLMCFTRRCVVIRTPPKKSSPRFLETQRFRGFPSGMGVAPEREKDCVRPRHRKIYREKMP